MPKIVYPQLKEGDFYNSLEVLKVFSKFKEGRKYGKKYFELKCFCGNVFEWESSAIMNRSKSCCGCSLKIKTNHGLSDTRTYRSWRSMVSRCISPTERELEFYKGTKVCDRWLEPDGQGFLNFLMDMGERPEGTSIDRIDTNGNYDPENCRWADRSTQSYNQKIQRNNTSGCAGVYWSKVANKWAAYINKDGKRLHIGLFDVFEEAVQARKDKELGVYGYNV